MMIEKKSGVFLSLFILAIYILYFLHLKVNVPVVDDYWYLVEFANLRDKTGLDFWRGLIIVKNSHWCIPSYLFGYGFLLISGEITSNHMLWVGMFSMIGIFLILYKLLKRIQKIELLLPVALILFTPQVFSVIFWPILALEMSFTFFLLFLFSYLLVRGKRLFWLLFVAVAINFSFGSGMGIWIAGGIGVFLRYSKKDFLWWCIIGVFSILLYFWGVFMFNEGIPTERPEVTIINLAKILVFFVGFMGNGFDFFPTFLFSKFYEYNTLGKAVVLLRTLLIFSIPITLIWLFLKGILKYRLDFFKEDKNLFALILVCYVLISGGIVALFRAQFGLGGFMAYRYKFYGVVNLLALLLLFYNKPKSFRFVLAICLLYFSTGFVNFYPYAKDYTLENASGSLNLDENKNNLILKGYGAVLDSVVNNVFIPQIDEKDIFKFEPVLELKNCENISSAVQFDSADSLIFITISGALLKDYIYIITGESGKRHFIFGSIANQHNKGRLLNRVVQGDLSNIDESLNYNSIMLCEAVRK